MHYDFSNIYVPLVNNNSRTSEFATNEYFRTNIATHGHLLAPTNALYLLNSVIKLKYLSERRGGPFLPK